MINSWKKFIFKINDVYGNSRNTKLIPQADIHCYFQQSDFIDDGKHMTIHKRVKTLCIDLHKSEAQLRKEMNRTTRYQINRAGRDQLFVEHVEVPGKEDVHDFIRFFNPFAREKGIERCREDKINALRQDHHLIISNIYHRDGQKLVSHLYIVDGTRAIMLYSCSVRFADTDVKPIEIGRANRYLHWQDLLFFKQNDYFVYDFLGLSIDKGNLEEQNINKFKKGFGGREEVNCQSYVPATWKGVFLLMLLRCKWRHQQELVKKRAVLKEN